MLMDELGLEAEPTIIYVDNIGAKRIAEGNATARSKHIDIRFHFVQEALQTDEYEVRSIGTHDNTADIFTKTLGPTVFEQHRDQLIEMPPKLCAIATAFVLTESDGIGRSFGYNSEDIWTNVSRVILQFI